MTKREFFIIKDHELLKIAQECFNLDIEEFNDICNWPEQQTADVMIDLKKEQKSQKAIETVDDLIQELINKEKLEEGCYLILISK